MPSPRTRDLLAAAVFVAFGLAFALGARTYEVGSALRMGPGYLPLLLGGVLVVLGLVIAAQGLAAGVLEDVTDDDEEERGTVPWRSGLLLVAAILFFGVTVRDLGLLPSLLVTTFLAALAGHRTGVLAAAVIAVGLTAVCLVVFVVMLQLRLPVFGPALPV